MVGKMGVSVDASGRVQLERDEERVPSLSSKQSVSVQFSVIKDKGEDQRKQSTDRERHLHQRQCLDPIHRMR